MEPVEWRDWNISEPNPGLEKRNRSMILGCLFRYGLESPISTNHDDDDLRSSGTRFERDLLLAGCSHEQRRNSVFTFDIQLRNC